MQFISDRQSLAEQFVLQTQKQSSYLLSSRASRRKIVFEESEDPAKEQIENFQEEIQIKYTESIANKIYTFPLKIDSFDFFNDNQLKGLQGSVQINLFEDEQQESKNKFKIMNKKIKNENVNKILANIRSLKQNALNATLFSEQSLYQSSDTKNTLKSREKASIRHSNERGANRNLIESQSKKGYSTAFGNDSEDLILKKRLQTEPYEKPMGFIVKKR